LVRACFDDFPPAPHAKLKTEKQIPAQRQGLAQVYRPLPQEVWGYHPDPVLARGQVEDGPCRRILRAEPHGTRVRPCHGGAYVRVSDWCASTLSFCPQDHVFVAAGVHVV